MTAETILATVTDLRGQLRSLVILAAALTHQVAGARETLKQTEDNIINEIWSDEQYKNDRARNEQKRLARVNDERYIKAAEAVTAKEIDRAANNADILAVQNELAVATAQYQAAIIRDHVAGVQFRLQMVQVHSADQTSMEVKPEVGMLPVSAFTDLPMMAADVLDAYLHDTTSDLPQLAEVDRKICDIVRSGEMRFLDGAALQRVRDLYATLPATSASPVQPVSVEQDGDQWIAKGAAFTDLQSSHDYAFGATEEEARAAYVRGARNLEVPTASPVEDQATPVGEPAPAEEKVDASKAPYLKDTAQKKSEKVGGVRI